MADDQEPFRSEARRAAISRLNRYAFTNRHREPGGQVRLGLWNVPAIDTTMFLLHRVVEGEVGRLDLIANRYYQDPNLFWVIAQTNGLFFPLSDMEAGMELKIVPLDAIREAFNASSPYRMV